ncbi:MAG: hypothetical protein JWN04_4391 [Myxococcaceae bacterium]|nr:hypothetical protein [Myxococcaceae bacterium]
MKRVAWLVCVSLGLGCGARQQDAASSAPVVARPVEVLDSSLVSTAVVDAGLKARAEHAAVPSLEELLRSLPSASTSTSIGSPTNGRLEGGLGLPLFGPGFRHNDKRSREARFGTVELVRAIVTAADVVARALPGGELVVNDIGLPQGGAISHHGSHRAGRDADILFYLLDDKEQPLASVGAPIDPEGVGFDYKDLTDPSDDVRVHFDAPRTWRFVQALLEGPDSQVQRIFVVEHLRTRLLVEAERSHAAPALIARFAELTCQPSYPHDDHLHVRWFCSAEDLRAGCEDAVPLYPWREAQLRAAGVQPVLARRARSEEPAAVVTQADAEHAVLAARPHADVLTFLERRKAWEKQPHPGRPYCR